MPLIRVLTGLHVVMMVAKIAQTLPGNLYKMRIEEAFFRLSIVPQVNRRSFILKPQCRRIYHSTRVVRLSLI